MVILIQFFLTFSLIQVDSLSDPQSLVDYLNHEYSSISGNSISLYTLTKEIYWKTGERDIIQTCLLLNNTFKGLSFHILEVLKNQEEFSIVSHYLATSSVDLTGISFIQKALLNSLSSQQITLDELSVKKQNVTEAVLYSSHVRIENKNYVVDVLLFNETSFEYVSSSFLLTVPKTIIKESLKYSGIVAAGVLGFVSAFLGLFVYYRKFKSVPFVKFDDARDYVGEKGA